MGIEINQITFTIVFSYQKKCPPLKAEDFECFWCIEMNTPSRPYDYGGEGGGDPPPKFSLKLCLSPWKIFERCILAYFKVLIGANSLEIYKRESGLLVFQRETIIFSQRDSSFLVFQRETIIFSQRESSFLVFQRETIIFSQRESSLLVFQRETIIFSQGEGGISFFEENTFF